MAYGAKNIAFMEGIIFLDCLDEFLLYSSEEISRNKFNKEENILPTINSHLPNDSLK